MNTIVIALTILMAQDLQAKGLPKCGEPPVEWREYIHLDQNRNIPGRPMLRESEKETQYVYQFNVPKNKTFKHIRTARRLDAPKRADMATLYVAQSWTQLGLEVLTASLGAPVQILCAKKLNSHDTVFVWDPTHKERPFFTKRGAIPNAIEMSELYAKVLSANPASDMKFFPETEITGMLVHEKGIASSAKVHEFASIRREATLEPEIEPRSKARRLVPLHGFLGSPELVEQAARAVGKSRDEWIKEVYIPKIAAYFAHQHFKMGVLALDHTQNLAGLLDSDRGSFEGLARKDFNDLLPDYLKLISQRDLSENDLVRLFNVLNARYIDDRGKDIPEFERSFAGVFFGRYNAETVAAFEPDRFKRMEYALEFLDHYIKLAEAHIKKPIALSDEAKDALDWLKKGKPDAIRVKTEHPQFWNGLSSALSDVVQSVYDSVALERRPPVDFRIFPAMQTTLKKMFLSQEPVMATPQAAKWVYHTDWADFESALPGWYYAFDGDRIYALDSQFRLRGVNTESVPDEMKSVLRETVSILSSMPLHCGMLYSRLLEARTPQ